ncbi:MAG: hypothetical protein AAB663_03385 [Patescibacteria group bacterium]
MNEEQSRRGERIVSITDDGAAVETSREHELGSRIDALMSLTQDALQSDPNSALSRYLEGTVADIARARFLLGSSPDSAGLKHMVDTVTDKLENIDAQIDDYQHMINALSTNDGETTSPPTALFYHDQIRKLEAMKAELAYLATLKKV